MLPNIKISERVALLARVSPISQGVGSVSTGWVPMADHENVMAVIRTGVLGAAATVDMKFEQATSAAGAGAKDIVGKAITQIIKATGDNKEAAINLRREELDIANAFTHVRVTTTVAAAASLIEVDLLGADLRYGPATNKNAATVVQIV